MCFAATMKRFENHSTEVTELCIVPVRYYLLDDRTLQIKITKGSFNDMFDSVDESALF